MAAPRWTWLCAVPVLAAVGCDPGPVQKIGDGTFIPGPPTDTAATTDVMVCDARDENGTCTEYTGPRWDDASIANDCAGDVVPGPCPASDLGGCQYEPTGPLASTTWYYSGAYYSTADVAYLTSQCVQTYGTWM